MKPLFLGGGVTDSNYRGNISVILTNFSSWTVDIKKGDKIAQIMFIKKEEVDFEEVYGDSILFRDHVVLMETIGNSNIPRRKMKWSNVIH